MGDQRFAAFTYRTDEKGLSTLPIRKMGKGGLVTGHQEALDAHPERPTVARRIWEWSSALGVLARNRKLPLSFLSP